MTSLQGHNRFVEGGSTGPGFLSQVALPVVAIASCEPRSSQHELVLYIYVCVCAGLLLPQPYANGFCFNPIFVFVAWWIFTSLSLFFTGLRSIYDA
ncbi:hypothetical protein BC835DRAFT_1002335 [Cytidiella melzeri]|nr:hypothetical protein BC835DRAFT_1002335 [Cytidiella melzeri]